METAVAYFDRNGVPVNPLVLSLCTQTRTSKFAPLKPRVAQFKPAVPEYPPYPPYRGEYKSRMQEWAQTRTANAAKFHARELNERHTEFLAGNLELDRYMVEVFAFLERDDQNDHEDVLAFFTTIQDKLESGCFCPEESTTRFSAKLLKAWSRYQRDNNILKVAEEEDALPSTPSPEARVAAPVQSKLRPTAINIEAAYRMHLDGVEGSEDALYCVVGKLAQLVIGDRLADSPRVTEELQDVAQQATIAVWNRLPTFKGQPGQFYKWVKRICRNYGTDGFNKGLNEFKVRVPYEVENEDGDIMENPEIYPNEFRAEVQRELPPFIQGLDLKICEYIREDFDYTKIGQVLGLTEQAVKHKVFKMRTKIKEMNAITAKRTE